MTFDIYMLFYQKLEWFFDSGLVFSADSHFPNSTCTTYGKLEGGGVTLDRSASAQRKYVLKRLMEVQD